MKLFRDSIFYALFLLMCCFVVGYVSIAGMHIAFQSIVSDLDKKIKNEQARYKIGEYILQELNSVEINYYNMAMLFREDVAIEKKNEIIQMVDHIKEAIDVLEKGGTVHRHLKLNTVDAVESIEYITYVPDSTKKYTFEAIDLSPKLAELDKRLEDIISIIRLRNEMKSVDDIEKRNESINKIELFMKQMPTQFIRLKENAGRLLYESKQNMDSIERVILEQKNRYINLELTVTIIIMTLVMFFGYVVSRKIQKSNQLLRDITEKAKLSAIEAFDASAAKSQFLANMSHEVRTPLNAIIGFSELLCNANIPKKEHEQSVIVHKSAQSLLSIINDILDISKIESGKFEIAFERFYTRPLLERIVELYSIRAKEKDLRFIYDIDPRVSPVVIGDGVRLQQVISNLLSNAIKFTPPKRKVSFEVICLMEHEHKTNIRFSIKDEGIGISKEHLQSIFEPFTQADGGISRKYGGTGLGLSIAQKITDLMGSKIEVDSKEGEGSHFYFDARFEIPEHSLECVSQKAALTFALGALSNDTDRLRKTLQNHLVEFGRVVDFLTMDSSIKPDLIFCFGEKQYVPFTLKYKKENPHIPLVYVGCAETMLRIPEFHASVDYVMDAPIYGSKVFNIIASVCQIEDTFYKKEEQTQKFTGSVLVAEDNVNNQKLISVLLEKLGLECDIANDGVEAILKYQQKHYDLILMDINMPIMDGISALKEIKMLQDMGSYGVPIVALTANTLKGDKELYMSEGMDDYLAKPIETNALVAILNKYLSPASDFYIEESFIPDLSEKKEIEVAPVILKSKIVNIQPYDKQEVMKQLLLDEETVNMLLDSFFMTLHGDLFKIERAISSGDVDEIYKSAHYLKGSCANLLMKQAADILGQMEEMAKEGAESGYAIEELKDIFEALKTQIQGE